MKKVGKLDTFMSIESIDIDSIEILKNISIELYFGMVLIEPIDDDIKISDYLNDIDNYFRPIQSVNVNKMVLIPWDFDPKIIFSYIGADMWRFTEFNDETHEFIVHLQNLCTMFKYEFKISLLVLMIPFELVSVNF